MCGITGFWHLRTKALDPQQLIDQMTKSLYHRGPNDQGTWIDPQIGIALGQRRLSIVDLSPLGHQPMISTCGRYVIVFNGEIYNASDIKQSLEERSCHIEGHSDTRILLEAISEWGLDHTLTLINGMFAIALWDRTSQTLYFIRDRLGVKPLYWVIDQEIVLFGSELKSLHQHPNWNPHINPAGIASILRYNYIAEETCIYDKVRKVKPATMVIIKANHEPEVVSYWSSHKTARQFANNSTLPVSFEEAKQNLHLLLDDSVRLRMVADVPVGAFLSGGIDSSLVVALMQKQSPRPIKTFSIGFTDQDFNEAPFAKKVAQHLKTDHYEVYLEPNEAFDILEKIPYHFDEPFADVSQIPTYLVSRLAKQQVDVVLSGDGGDELFAGYNRYIYADKLWSMMRLLPRPIRQIIGKLGGKLPQNLLHSLGKISKIPQFSHKVQRLFSLLDSANSLDLYNKILMTNDRSAQLMNTSYGMGGMHEDPFSYDKTGLDYTTLMQLNDIDTYLCGDILTKVDRATMAHGLEGREPLLDYRLVEFAFGLPLSYKMEGGKGKKILREILYDYVPKALVERPKMGFGVPIGQWLRDNSRFRQWACDLIHSRSVQDLDLNHTAIQKLWIQHTTNQANHQYALWGILMLLSWHQRWGKV